MTKKFRPITPSLRKLVMPSFDELNPIKKRPEKNLTQKKSRINGRNNHGRITCRHRGGGHKRKFRLIDFRRDKDDILAKVASIEYDPNRTAHIALLHYTDGEKSYIIAPQGLKVGDNVGTTKGAPFKVGYCMKLKYMPLGSVIHNIELYPGRGATLVRSAGLSAQLLAKSANHVTIKMPSGEVRLIKEECKATLGSISNSEHNLRVDGKAGRTRWKGIRPTVRGVAMNPVDHPHGGGEGKSKGNHPQSPWAGFAKGFKTKKNKKKNKMIIKSRRKK
ncbi:MAG: 50S ribosomal protein L2 [Candidatus Anoxychlamydiales bacterium]|nr:50S ribosomal protein L2 [Candidatus Anoxychlamydiales bacterium]